MIRRRAGKVASLYISGRFGGLEFFEASSSLYIASEAAMRNRAFRPHLAKPLMK
jgi:hypothetical protein